MVIGRSAMGTARVAGRVLLVVALLACGGGDPPITRPPVTPPVVITTGVTLPQATVGVAYDVTLQATGGIGDYAWQVVSGALPDSLTLSAGGRLSGMPTQAGTQSLSVRVVSGSVSNTIGLALTVVPPPLAITTAALPVATLGVSYQQFLDVSGGSGPVTWSMAGGTLPAGISLSSAGILLGNATALGESSFRVRAERGTLSAERGYALRVVAPPLAITPTTLPNAKVGEPYAVQMRGTGGVGGYLWAGDSLPPGLTLSPSGLIDGTPTVAGTWQAHIVVQSGTERFGITASLTVDAVGFPSSVLVTMPGNVFVPLLVQLARGGTVTWRFGTTPHNVIFGGTPGAPADITITSDRDVARTFPTVGTFRYDCTIHPGMSGVVEVKP